ncbi:MAG: molybdopterin dinucleotide binding domain-containing protein [Candidatus Helarchaeota archaeon]
MSFYKFLVPKIERTISIIRTFEQEVSSFLGKNSEEYFKSASICIFSEEDINELGINEGSNVKVSTNWGSVILKAIKSPYAKKGIVFIPIGIWACQVISNNFEDEGHIKFKNFKGFIESTEEKVKSYDEIKELFLK